MSVGTRFRVGMDAGGTFTDLVVLDHETQTWTLHKVLSDRENPSEVLRAGLAKAAKGENLTVDEFVSKTEMFILGTTVATNALLQHRGAKVGLLATAGHEDSIEIREGHKEDGHRYDWDFPPATMLVPRERRFPIRERVLYDGSEKTALDSSAVEAAVAALRDQHVEAVGISFLWSFQNPKHEKLAAQIVKRDLPNVHLTSSHELLPMIGEYNRVSTVVLNCYLAPVVARFVRGMEEALETLGFNGPVRYFQANGGMASGKSLISKAVYALNSGPAAAPTAGSRFSRMYDRDVITVDAGGTSFDVGLVRGNDIEVRLTSDVSRYRVGIPMVNIETLGAGGGSIAWLDPRGLLAVGPDSAEARPGPACYGFGGTEPTVTDALVVLGWFNQTALLGGEMPVLAKAASDAVRSRIAEPLGLSVEDAADGIIRVAAEAMVGGVRRVSIEAGYDPRDAILVAAGGAGPAFACRLARELGMNTVVVPRVASGFCAFGAALSDVRHDYLGTYTVLLDDLDLAHLNELLEQLEQRGRADLAEEGIRQEAVRVRRSFEMRYHDQIHNCLVQVRTDRPIDAGAMLVIRGEFDRRHAELYTYSEPENKAVLVNVHLSVTGTVSLDSNDAWFRPLSLASNGADGAKKRRDVYLPSDRKRVSTRVLGAHDFASGASVSGPAIVEEVTMTLVVEDGWSIRLDDRGFYELNWNGLTGDSVGNGQAGSG